MFTNNCLLFTLVVSVLYTLILLQQVDGTVLDAGDNLHQYPVVYRRFVRRRPPIYPQDEYVEEIVEIFHTKEKPPRFILCDFCRQLDECKLCWESRERKIPITTSTATTSTTAKPTTTTTTSAITPETTREIFAIPHLDNVEYVDYYGKEAVTDEDVDGDVKVEENYDYYAEDDKL